MDQTLLLASQVGSVIDLYSLILLDPYILHKIDNIPFIHTPLHEASSTGNIDLAMELMILKPSFAMKLNVNGSSPLHLAVKNNKSELALELIKFEPNLVRIRGRGGMTPMHLVLDIGDVDLLTEFLLVCPESIRDANVKGETALYITVMNDRSEELEVLKGWMQRMRNSDASSIETHVLDRCDRAGNTALHVAAYSNNHQMVKQLLKCKLLNRNIQNKNGMTALDVLRANGHQMNLNTEKLIQEAGGRGGTSVSKVATTTSVFLRKPITFREYCFIGMARYRSRISDGTRNALLVITALIITATYQTAVQPNNKDKKKDLANEEFTLEIALLWGFNTVAFCMAMALTFILLPVGREYTWWYILISTPLVCSYAISGYFKYDLQPLFVIIYMMVIFGFFIYLIQFYVRWKRTAQKKIPQPKSDMLFTG